MNLNIDFLIDFFDKYSDEDSEKVEMGEQESGGESSPAKPAPKWADTVGGPARGVANALPKKGQYWRDLHGGPKRGVANTLW